MLAEGDVPSLARMPGATRMSTRTVPADVSDTDVTVPILTPATFTRLVYSRSL